MVYNNWNGKYYKKSSIAIRDKFFDELTFYSFLATK